MENESKPWPIFDRTYKRQNKLQKKLEERESSDDDDDSVSSIEDEQCPLAPPAPTFTIGRGETVYEVELGNEGQETRSPVALKPEDNIDTKQVAEVHSVVQPILEGYSSLQSDSKSSYAETDSENLQESGIPTYENPKSLQAGPPTQQNATRSKPIFPSQTLQHPTQSTMPKPPQSARQVLKEKEHVKLDSIPRSIPLTICYSLRSAIGDGSTRQRNSHTLMEQRPLRPNGCAVDVSYWSHRGKRSYMEGRYDHFKLHRFEVYGTNACTPLSLDRFVIEHIGSTSKIKEHAEPITLLAVFDGHGGSAAR